MVHVEDPLARYASDLINRLSLMSFVTDSPSSGLPLKDPPSDPTHLCPRHRRILEMGREPLTVKPREKSPVLRRSAFDTPRVRLSFPIESAKKEKPRPLTPVLTVHSQQTKRRVYSPPAKVDYLRQLPVELTMSLLLDYLHPRDLISLRSVNRYHHMLTELRVVKKRWTSYLISCRQLNQSIGQENLGGGSCRPSSLMSKSRGILSPIQHAGETPPRCPSLLWQVLSTPKYTGPRGKGSTPSSTGPQRKKGTTPHTPSSPSLQTGLSVKGRKISPVSSGSKHPSKRAASARDIWEDTLPTPEKYNNTNTTHRGGGTPGAATPGSEDKRRTPFATLTFGTPNTLSTCSSKASLSSTSSLLTPDVVRHWSALPGTPTSAPHHDRDGFKVPFEPARTRSRQRLRRL